MPKISYLLLGLLLLANTSMYGQRRAKARTKTRAPKNHTLSSDVLTRRIASHTTLGPLPQHLFRAPVPTELRNQPFIKLSELKRPELTGPEYTLLLTHKFIQENNAFPRTAIFQQGTRLAPEQYTMEQKAEVSLGNKVTKLLRSEQRHTPIGQELQELQYEFAPQYTAHRVLEHLNLWLEEKQEWPREHNNPTTLEESYETDLAHQANKITGVGANDTPPELREVIADIRSYYDPTYNRQTLRVTKIPEYQSHSFTQKPEQTQSLLLELEQWVTTEKRWPRSQLSKKSTEYTPAEAYETDLGNRVDQLVRYSHPENPNIWLSHPVFKQPEDVLRTGTPYRGNPNLEQVRKLYYYATYLKLQTEKGYLPKNLYENFKNWFNELETLFPHNPYKDIKLE